MSFLFYVIGNGRKGYLERTIASWEFNLADKPKYKVIFDDSGNSEYRDWLNKKFGNKFEIFPISDINVGHNVATNIIFDYIRNLDIDYVLQVEEDWILNRELNVAEIIKTMDYNPDILQMRIPRTAWYSDGYFDDIKSGSLVLRYINDLGSQYSFLDNRWYKIRNYNYFWSHNPCIFNKKIAYENYGDLEIYKDKYIHNKENFYHEYNFGIYLFNKYPNSSFGYWAKNPFDSYVTHIGIHNDNLIRQIPDLKI